MDKSVVNKVISDIQSHGIDYWTNNIADPNDFSGSELAYLISSFKQAHDALLEGVDSLLAEEGTSINELER